jgi:hypothetical protein
MIIVKLLAARNGGDTGYSLGIGAKKAGTWATARLDGKQ